MPRLPLLALPILADGVFMLVLRFKVMASDKDSEKLAVYEEGTG